MECVLQKPPHARPAPSNKAIVASGVGAKVVRQISPRRTRTQDPKDAVQHAAVIYTRHATRLIRQDGLDGGPFIIGEFVAHDSKLRFGSLNHRLPAELNFRIGGRYRVESGQHVLAMRISLLTHLDIWPTSHVAVAKPLPAPIKVLV